MHMALARFGRAQLLKVANQQNMQWLFWVLLPPGIQKEGEIIQQMQVSIRL